MHNLAKKNPTYLVLALFILVIFLITFSWFKEGKLISNNSEENLNILSPSRTALHYSSFWWTAGTGAKNPFLLPRESVFWTLSLMERAAVPNFLIQAIFIGSLIGIGLISMYAFTKYGLNLGAFVAGLSSLFYLLNIYSLTQIWKRFLYNGMIAWAYLPLFLLFWFRWILDNNFKWLFIFLITSLLFTYTFAHPAYFLTFWIPAGIFVLIKAWEIRKDFKRVLRLICFSLLGLFLWCVVNIWWLYPTLVLSTSWTDSNFPQSNANFGVLTAVSQSFPVNEILLLRQSWYLGHDNDWYDFYHNPFIFLISVFILCVAVLGFIKLKNEKYRKYLTGLALLGLFISKGSNFPLGYTFYNFLFSAFPYTAALRNPYEKFGLVWLLPYAIFFSYGFYSLFSKFKDWYKKTLFIAVTLFLSLGILVYPMWSGDIFPLKHRLQVPDYYKEANIFLNSHQVERMFHIPFLTEGVKMTYEWGYIGEDPSDSIFASENLSSAYVPLYTKTLKLLSSYFDNKYASNIFGLIGIPYIVFQRDIAYPKVDFKKTQEQIESWQGINKVKTFGKLDLYSLDPKIVKPRIYASSNIIKINSLNEGMNLVASDKWDQMSAFTLEDIGAELKNNLTPQISYTKISNTKYQVHISGSNSPYVLILNNSYDPSWRVIIDNQIFVKHFLVNGFANGWLIDKKGDYELDIRLVIWPWD